jgi:two-component system, response regulator
MIPILIVDDSRDDLKLAELVFRECRIINPIDLVSSGAACVEHLEKQCRSTATAHPRCSLVFIDLGMSPMNGVQTMHAINDLALTSKPWLIMLSGMTDVKLIRAGYEAGAKTFMNKPLRPTELKEFLENNESSINVKITATGYELHWV